MTFLNPFLLFGSLLAVVPLIIHLWSKRQAKKIEFSTLMFLLEAHKKSVKRLQLKNIFLLILRMLIMILIALALSRPVLTSGFALSSPISSTVSCVIILDNSYSMGYIGLKERRFEVAKRKAIEVINSLKTGDSASLILMSERPKPIFKSLNRHLKEVAKAIEESELSQGGTEVYASLAQAYQMLDRSSDPNREIYLITDLTLNGWKNFQKNFDEPKTGIFIIDSGESNSQNAAIESLRFPNKLIGIKMPFKTELVVHNFSQFPLKNATLSFSIDGIKKYEIEVNLGANSKATYDFLHRFEHSGTHFGQVELSHDRLQLDDTRYFAVDIYGQIKVLCLGNRTTYLNLALNPQAETSPKEVSTESESIITPTIVLEDEFEGKELDIENYEVAILADISQIRNKEGVRLQAFLKEGKGVIIFIGKNAAIDSYNGTEFIPAQLDAKRTHTESALFISEYNHNHPAFKLFDEPLISGSEAPRFYSSYLLKPKEGSKVLAKFNDGSPAIVESGTTILINASPSDMDWTNFPLKSLFLPLIQQLVMHLKSNQMRENINLTVDETYKDYVKEIAAKEVYVYSPAEPNNPTLVENLYGKFQFEQTENTGVYQVEVRAKGQIKRSFFAVNVNSEESNLQRISEAEVKRKLGSRVKVISTPYSSVKKSILTARSGREIWRELIVVASILTLLETLISNSKR